MTQKNADGVANLLASLSGQSVTFTPSGFPCTGGKIEIEVQAIDNLGNMDSDKAPGTVFRVCEPK